MAGFGFVIIGQSGVFPFQLDISGIILLGATLALLAAFCNALSPAFSIRHAAIAHKKIKETGENIEEIYCTMFSLVIQRLVAGVVLLIIAFYLGEQLTTRVLLAGCLIGFLIVPLAVTSNPASKPTYQQPRYKRTSLHNPNFCHTVAFTF